VRTTDDYISRRSPVLATGGAVASSQPLATLAGVDVLRVGGNAADAAVAVAAALNVTQPCSTGLGGDAFCLYYDAATRSVRALNGSGRSAAALTMDRVEAEGLTGRLPDQHAYAVTVPGAAAAWADVVRTLGRLPLADVLAPAIRLAAEGFPVAPCAARWWQGGAKAQLGRHRCGGELMIDGRGPRAGEIMRIPTLADSLRTLAEEGSRAFYEGRIAERIVAVVQEEGGALTMDDLAAHASQWVEPISIDYRGVRVWECPPNGQGLAALLALDILQQFGADELRERTFQQHHLMIEAMRLAFADAAWAVADPQHAAIPLAELLSADYAAERAKLIDARRANRRPARGMPPAGEDTVYFCTADAEGNACSFINSNYMGFGTGIVPEGCGFSLQNRGCGFVLRRGHLNCLAPRKRPYHTIIPGMATRAADDSLYAAFGVMGGMMQPQGHLQVVVAMVDEGLDPQSALDRPRFQLAGGAAGGHVLVEDTMDEDIVASLDAAGHQVTVLCGASRSAFGLGQIIRREPPAASLSDPQPPAVLWSGSDGRGDGQAIGLP
jgi:gamma-glutamyltranspeptidase/glutathione hydrolase